MMDRSRVRIAVVGTGIAGLATAWLLGRRHAVTVFEADPRVGGHSHTVTVGTAGGEIPVDTGFMVYNEHTYPLLTRLFAHLDVPTQTTDHVVLGQHRRRLARIWRRLAQGAPGPAHQPAAAGLRAHAAGHRALQPHRPAYLQQPGEDDLTLGDFLARHGFGRSLGEWYLLPMAAAIWSAPVARMLDYPARSFLSFFANHGLLSIQGHHVWRTVAGGSREYVRRMVAELGPRIRIATPIRSVRRWPGGVEVTDGSGQSSRFDQVVLACHADQSLAAARGRRRPASASSSRCFPYQPNRAILHGDPA